MNGKQIEDLIAGILKEEIDKEISRRVEIIMSNLDTNGLIPVGGINHKYIDFDGVQDNKTLDLIPLITRHIVKLFRDPGKNNLLTEGSLSHTYINFTGFKLTGDFIENGVIKEFNSTGIQDLATDCQVTVTDENTVVENNLVANSMDIKGRLRVEDELALGDKAKNTLTTMMLEKFLAEKTETFVKAIGDNLQTRKLDLSNLQVNGEPLVAERMLSRGIIKSNLQELGELKELKVKGDTLLADSVFVTKGKVGINTTEPVAALTVWDQEAEIVFKKAYKNTGYIGTERSTNLVVGANNKNNLVLGADGTVNVDDINIASIKVSVSDKEPGHKGNPGDIMFNSNPSNVPCIGWQCLGGTRWKRF
jgi:hypothetical protein